MRASTTKILKIIFVLNGLGASICFFIGFYYSWLSGTYKEPVNSYLAIADIFIILFYVMAAVLTASGLVLLFNKIRGSNS